MLDMGFRGSLGKTLALSEAIEGGRGYCGRASVPVSLLGVGIHQPRLGHCRVTERRCPAGNTGLDVRKWPESVREGIDH
jgi:hypothetical protein